MKKSDAYYTQRQRDLEEIIAKNTDPHAVRNAKRCLQRWAREDAKKG